MSYAANYILATGFHRLGQSPARRATLRSFDVRLIDLVRPEGYWPQPFTLEQAFEIFRWMVAGAGNDGAGGPRRWRAIDLLSATSGEGYTSVIPVRSVADLRSRFHYGILGRAKNQDQAAWRQALGIDVSATVQIKARIFKPFAGAPFSGFETERAIQDTFERITTGSAGVIMAWSLNDSHPSCRTLHHVTVEVSADKFYFVLTYGDPLDTFYSSWGETIAKTREGEPFVATLARARDVFDLLAHGRGEADTTDVSEFTRSRMRPAAAVTAGEAA